MEQSITAQRLQAFAREAQELVGEIFVELSKAKRRAENLDAETIQTARQLAAAREELTAIHAERERQERVLHDAGQRVTEAERDARVKFAALTEAREALAALPFTDKDLLLRIDAAMVPARTAEWGQSTDDALGVPPKAGTSERSRLDL